MGECTYSDACAFNLFMTFVFCGFGDLRRHSRVFFADFKHFTSINATVCSSFVIPLLGKCLR